MEETSWIGCFPEISIVGWGVVWIETWQTFGVYVVIYEIIHAVAWLPRLDELYSMVESFCFIIKDRSKLINLAFGRYVDILIPQYRIINIARSSSKGIYRVPSLNMCKCVLSLLSSNFLALYWSSLPLYTFIITHAYCANPLILLMPSSGTNE